MCEKLVSLDEVDLVGIGDSGEGTPLGVVIRSRKPRPVCEACGGRVWSKGYRTVVLVDLPAFGPEFGGVFCVLPGQGGFGGLEFPPCAGHLVYAAV